MKTSLVRKTCPRIRKVLIRGVLLYRVDARRKGTSGRLEHFKQKNDAEKRAAELERDFAANGTDGLALSGELRGLTILATQILEPYGKTVLEAAQFYKTHLDAETNRINSSLA